MRSLILYALVALLLFFAWNPPEGFADPTPKVAVPENLAKGKPATASSTESRDHRPGAAVDGDPETRWCAADNGDGQWWQVDLGKPERLTGCRLYWEHDGPLYRFKVEGSPDGRSWQMLSDQTKTEERDRERDLRFDAAGVRCVRVTATDVEPGHWASLFEVEIFGTGKVVVDAAKAARPERMKAVGGKGLLAGIRAPAGFQVTLFAEPPQVRYPTCLAAAPTGEVFVGIDENGSLDRKPDRGRVVRCVDADGDGKADRFNVFARMDSPRGLIVDDNTVFVLHPPDLTAYHDDDGDGVADRSDDLVRGIGFDLKHRGADHTTNGIRLGIDGWIYIAVGDYGFVEARGKDGTKLQHRGGGVARVRTDGSGLEMYSQGQRNIFDAAVDPYLNVFTRDNTNDGGGWDVRLSQIVPTGHYGYPSLFVHFPDEIIPPLADYGGGSPTGSLYLQEPGFPPPYGDALYTCDWGRSVVYRHPLEPMGAGFKARQEPFVELPRPTDMDVDGRSRIYISSWKDGGFTFDKPDVGYVIRVTYPGSEPAAFPDLKAASDEQLLRYLGAPSQVLRQSAQRQILSRGPSPARSEGLARLAQSKEPRPVRIAAIFTLLQLDGERAIPGLVKLTEDADVREFALRALADRSGDSRVPDAPFLAGLNDPNPRVRLQAAFGLGRLGRKAAADAILPLLADDDPLVSHVAVNALISLHAIDAGIKAIRSSRPKWIAGGERVLQAIHEPRAVKELIAVLGSADKSARLAALQALCRLYHREGPYTGGDWWGTRPDTSGPYYKPIPWEESPRIAETLRAELHQADSETLGWLLGQIARNKIDFEETAALALKLARDDPSFRPTAVDILAVRPKLSSEAVGFLAEICRASTGPVALRSKALRALQRHAGQPEARETLFAALAAAGASGKLEGDLSGLWQDFVRDERNSGHAAGFVQLAEGPDPGRRTLAYAVLIQIEANPRVRKEAHDQAQAALDRAWGQPERAVSLLRAIGETRSERHSLQVRGHLKDERKEVREAANAAAQQLGLDRAAGAANRPDSVTKLPFEQVVARVNSDKGDRKLGQQLFDRQSCISCHTVSKDEALKGPYLGDITNRYNRTELAESILKPSAKIAQGFETQRFALDSGQIVEGFVVRESGDEIELRNASGVVTVIPKSQIEERGKSEMSVMPNGIADGLSVHELASIMAYLESLRAQSK